MLKIIRPLIRSFGVDIVRYHAPTVHSPAQGYADLERKYPSLPELKLHFGCGPRVLKGWINLDLFFEPYENYLQYYKDAYAPVVRGTKDDFYAINIVTEGLPLPDNSVDLIFHEDFFEHLPQKEQIIFLAETYRVMKPGAVHRINTPNLRASMREHSDFKKGKAGVYVGEWINWHHFSVIDPAILQSMAEIVGYSQIQFNSKNQSIAKDRLPVEYRPDDPGRVSLDGNVFADLVK
ncbi:MAG: methyltransferase domain-containing protein [Sphingobacteriia bacterium]|nr:methyltransferase domain-containing protein [Sphingobacteriia bacterium]